MKKKDVLKKLQENNFFMDDSNKDNLKKKLDFMSESVNIVIEETEKQIIYWKTLYNKFESGYYNKAISELCLQNINTVLESAHSAKKYLSNIKDIDNDNQVTYWISKYQKEFNNINKLNMAIKETSKNLLTIDKLIDDEISSSDSDSDIEK